MAAVVRFNSAGEAIVEVLNTAVSSSTHWKRTGGVWGIVAPSAVDEGPCGAAPVWVPPVVTITGPAVLTGITAGSFFTVSGTVVN